MKQNSKKTLMSRVNTCSIIVVVNSAIQSRPQNDKTDMWAEYVELYAGAQENGRLGFLVPRAIGWPPLSKWIVNYIILHQYIYIYTIIYALLPRASRNAESLRDLESHIHGRIQIEGEMGLMEDFGLCKKCKALLHVKPWGVDKQ